MHRELVEAFYTRFLTAGADADPHAVAERVLAPEWRSVGNYSGQDKDRPTFLKQVAGFHQLMPDLRWQIEEVLEVGERVVVRSRASGTPRGVFMGVEPKGRRFEVMTIDIHTVREGRVVLSHHVEDWMGAVMQLRG